MGYLRKLLMIKKDERKAFTSLSLLMFFILFNVNILRSIKDSLLAINIGPQTIGFIKILEIIVAIFCMYGFIALSNRVSMSKVFQYITIFFIVLFALFAFVLFPFQEYIHMSQATLDKFSELYPSFQWLFVVIGKWSFVLCYIFAELWPIIIFSVLFWQFSNANVSLEQASRFYPSYSLIGQVNLIFSGIIVLTLTYYSQSYIKESTSTAIDTMTTQLLFCLAIFVATIIIFLQRYIANSCFKSNEQHVKINKGPSFFESIKLTFSSKHLTYICVIVLCYSMCICLFEGSWLYMSKLYYKNSSNFIIYQAKIFLITGVITIAFSLTGSHIIARYGWLKTALITPVIFLIIGGVYFVLLSAAHIDLFIIILLGAGLLALGKSAKYVLSDATKEMAYIPLKPDIRGKGKVAVEIVGIYSGKVFAAVIQSLLFVLFPTIATESFSSFIGSIYILAILTSVTAVFFLNKRMKRHFNVAVPAHKEPSEELVKSY